MKRVLLIIAIATVFSQNTGAKDIANQTAPILSLYYNIKDALVAGNPGLAASKAGELERLLTIAKESPLTESSRNSLVKDASRISVSKDIKVQRAAFADLSASLLLIAKREKLGVQPVYQMYCPMKKSHWLSNERIAKNPYYGSSMLTCGKVEATL